MAGLLSALKDLRWYDIPNYLLNQLTVGDYAYCYSDLSYAAAVRQQLDLYVPKQPRADKALIVFVHGGSWQHGKKEDYIFLAQNLAQSGFYVACINYQFAPTHLYPAFVDDTTLAINWLIEPEQAQQYGYNAQHIILMGHSAGAFNVMSVLYPSKTQQASITQLSAIRAVIGIAGPYSFDHRGDPVAKDAFAQDVAPEFIMPSFFVYSNPIRHLLLIAGKDHLVGDENTDKMQQALQQVDNHVEVQRIPNTSHVSIIATLARGLDRLFKTKKAVIQFIDGLEL